MDKRRKMLRFLCLALALLAAAPARADRIPAPPPIAATSWVLLDHQSGQLLGAHEPDRRVEPASITKIMTSYIAFDELKAGHVKATDEVLISEKAWRTQGSRTFVEVGKRVPFEALLHGSIIQSGNDATVAIAEHIAGDESVFAQMMNKQAQRLGMKNSRFANATGLPSPELYTTARDVAILSSALIRDFPQHYPLFSQREFAFGHRGEIRQHNRNLLLDMDPTADGIKTGHTESAGFCLAASAIRDGRRLIAVVMGTGGPRERAQASKALLDYGFRFTETVSVLGPGKPAARLRVYKGAAEEVDTGLAAPLALSVPRGAGAAVKIEPKAGSPLVAPVARGQVLGTVAIRVDGKVVRTEPLVALAEVPEGSLWQRLADTVRLWIDG